jgi:hypothetical protein
LAIIVCVPAVRKSTLSDATPVASTLTVPNSVVPSTNVTGPAGTAPSAVTVAVNVTASAPATDGFADDVSSVVVAVPVTVCVKVAVPALKLVEPEYCALTMWSPLVENDAEKLAVPATTGTVVAAPPSTLKATVPVGVPAPGAKTLIEAVYVTPSPIIDGFDEDDNETKILALLTAWINELVLAAYVPLPE